MSMRLSKTVVRPKMRRPAVNLNAAGTSEPPRKCLLFDRRYGWVLDDWREPSEEALSGGRGMFCILPLARAAMEKASEMINFAACSTIEALEKRGTFSPKSFEAVPNSHISKIASSGDIQTDSRWQGGIK